ncbi:RHS repeat-associated core domain-containing protein [Pseudomonas maioricensis]|uniref:RHS repeat-associated core domain-containing protein n=1 Tax=Pseudomonas maioricensis TaxID=1766623 RepID=UPI001FABD84D|nr:RHS repeat-associated core domain-containing protein [Pseudomonas sp. S25]
MPTPDLLVHRHTPVISVQDSRALNVRVLQFHRRVLGDLAELRVEQQTYDAQGRPLACRDPRLFALFEADADVPANLTQTFSLGGALLLSQSTDAGWRLGLRGEAGQWLESWDGRGTHSAIDYDDMLRPQAIQQQGQTGPACTLERFTYGGAGDDAALHNRCGRLLRHDDPAGTHWGEDYSLGGLLIQEARRFARDLESPDWPVEESGRDALLEPTAQAALTRRQVNALGETTGQTDAQGNVQRLEMTCAGTLRSTHLRLAGQSERLLVGDICYNAFGQVDAETAGNGVQTRTFYDPATGLLLGLTARKSDGTTLQDLNYEHDPVGNILRIEDAAQPTRYFRNQAIVDVGAYRYDTLYQLIEATGREARDAAIHPPLPVFQSPAAPNQLANYSQFYDYDAGGNLLTLRHVGGQQYTRRMITARYSNRSLPVFDDHIPDEAELTAAFDANGNLLQLQPGQGLTWDARNQLQKVTPVQREDAANDDERYVYDGSGQRLRKVRMILAANTTHRAEVRYLPGLEMRTDTATGRSLDVITVQAGRSEVRVLHWLEDSNPDDIANDQVRYSLSDHLRSSTLELDGTADVISQERYYPFGGTSWWAGRNAVEANYKTVRYSDKERDASGLYYYGLRCYAPWLFRWINPDPLGTKDGLNLYRFCASNPVSRVDLNGGVTKLPADNLLSTVLDTYLDNEPDFLIGLGLPMLFSEVPEAASGSGTNETNKYLESDSPASHSSQLSDSSPPGSPTTLIEPTTEQHAALDILGKNNYSLNSRGLLVRDKFGGKVYRADRREPGEVLQQGFHPSDEFTAIKKMISGRALIVAETLEGAIYYAANSGHTYNFYEIDAGDIGGASLVENLLFNKRQLVEHITAYPEESPTSQTGEANNMYEAHLSHDDLMSARKPFVYLGKLKAQVASRRAVLHT